jgi:hypothetical protein
VVRFENDFLYRNTIVYTGIRPTGIWTVDVAGGKFTAEFELWFRYYGDAPATDVVFPTAIQPIDLGKPVKSDSAQGINYRLYQVKGSFRLDGAETNAAFGHHSTPIVFRNRSATSERVVYVPDPLAMPKTSSELTRQFAGAAFLIPSSGFELSSVSFRSERLPAGSRGELDALNPNIDRFPFSTVTVGMELTQAQSGVRRSVPHDNSVMIVAALAALLAGLVIADRIWRRRPLIGQLLLLPMLGTLLGLIYFSEIALVKLLLPRYADRVVLATDLALWALGALSVIAALERYVWQPAGRSAGRPPSVALRVLVALPVLISAGLGATVSVFQQSIVEALIGIALLIAIVGFAVHRNIASLISGIALFFERGFTIGDRVRVVGCGEGVVADIGWRATTLRTDDARMISIPNTIVAASVVERIDGARPASSTVVVDSAGTISIPKTIVAASVVERAVATAKS